MGNRKNKTNSSSTVHNTIFAPVMPSSEELASYTDLQLQTGIRPYSILNTRTQQSDINRPKVRETSYGSSTSNDYEDIQHQSKTEHYENTHQLQRTESGHEYLDLYDTKETIYPLKGTGCEIKVFNCTRAYPVLYDLFHVITFYLLRSRSENRKKKRRPYTTARNGSEIKDKALLVMLSSNNPSSPGYESLQLNHTEFFEYAQTMVTEEQDLTDDEIINDHCSKQIANANNAVNHYESVEVAHYSQYNIGSHRNQRSIQSLNSSESIFYKSRFNSSNKIEELMPGKDIPSESTIDNPYDTIDPEETGFIRSKSDNKSTGNAYAELDPKETGFYRRKADNSNSQLEKSNHGGDQFKGRVQRKQQLVSKKMIKMILQVYYLFFFAREVFSIELNRTITVCEKRTSQTIVHQNSTIKITSVQIGPLQEPYRIETGNIDLLSLSDDNSTLKQHTLEEECNEKQFCLVNATSINFTEYQIPRTIDVYRCGKQTINGVLTKNKIAFKCSHHAGTKDISVTLQHSSVTCKSNATTTKRRLSFSTNEVYTGRDYCYLLENSVEFGDDLSCYEPIFATLNYSCVGLIIGAIGGLSTIVIAALLLLALRLHMGNRENQTKSLSSVRNTKSSPVKPSSEELASYTDLQSQSGSRPYSILNTSTQQSDINRPNVRETSKGSSTSNDYEDIQHQSKNEHYEDTHHMQRTESDHEYSDLYDKNEIV
ncbi:unnamed protein product [Mytilus edulis]|uniref:Uncharacterized protein n=1 Tax=Mytilus edulis TaxID=6550 RepID=A0A8S3Q8L9_MYTED|nr:unnamed protein product [Mytilus edulis]